MARVPAWVKNVSSLKRHTPAGWPVDRVTYSPALQDEDSYYVIRRFHSLTQREQMEDAYYASDDWRLGPREGMLAREERSSQSRLLLPGNDGIAFLR